MSYRKTYNSYSNWVDYCSKNQDLIEELELDNWIFEREENFREFATNGKTNKGDLNQFNFNEIEESLFWKLHSFVTAYFESDAILFIKFEKVRTRRFKN